MCKNKHLREETCIELFTRPQRPVSHESQSSSDQSNIFRDHGRCQTAKLDEYFRKTSSDEHGQHLIGKNSAYMKKFLTLS